MKIKLLMAITCALFLAGCASEPKNAEFKAGVADCALMCKTNPEIKEYSQGHGGALLLLFYGKEEQKCICNR